MKPLIKEETITIYCFDKFCGINNENYASRYENNSKSITSYKMEGKTASTIHYTEAGEVLCNYLFEYYPFGHEKRTKCVFGDSENECVIEYYGYIDEKEHAITDCTKVNMVRKLNSKNQIVEERHYYENGSLDDICIYRYDSYGNLKTQVLDRNELKVEYNYDSDHNIILRNDYAKNILKEKKVFNYDFNQHGHWIKNTMQLIVCGAVVLEIISHRGITYYNQIKK